MSRKLLSDEVADQAVKLYESGITGMQLAVKFNISWPVMYRTLKRRGAKMRRSKDYSRAGERNNQYKHGYACGKYKREYYIFRGARKRCTDPNLACYKYYGGRGIQFKFVSFEQFISCLGRCPKGYTLDRIDNNGHYEPGNVRWASRRTQVINRRPRNRTHCIHGHELKPENVYVNPRGIRECRTCINRRNKHYVRSRG